MVFLKALIINDYVDPISSRSSIGIMALTSGMEPIP
jgi:hypothetical protein